jgi:hypothetical protein
MLTALVATAGAVMLLVLVVLTVVVIGIRQEPREDELAAEPASRIATLVRRLTGLHVRKPVPSTIAAEQRVTAPGSTRPYRPTG